MSNKFELLKNIKPGIIIVPDNYVHEIALRSLHEKPETDYGGKIGINKNITDENFSKATNQLAPGQKLLVEIYCNTGFEARTSEEFLEFLKFKDAILTGAQGASLFCQQKIGKLYPGGPWYIFFDEKHALWEKYSNEYRVPMAGITGGGSIKFSLGRFEKSRARTHLVLFRNP